MNSNFDSLFDSYLTQARHHRNYLEAKGYQQDPTDLEAESVDYYQPDRKFDESEPFYPIKNGSSLNHLSRYKQENKKFLASEQNHLNDSLH